MALLLPAPTRTLLHLLSLRCRSKSTAGADTNTMLSVFRSMLHLRGAKGHDAERLMAEYLATTTAPHHACGMASSSGT